MRLVPGTLAAGSGGARATGLVTLEASAIVNGAGPVVDGTPQVALLVDGEPIEGNVEDSPGPGLRKRPRPPNAYACFPCASSTGSRSIMS